MDDTGSDGLPRSRRARRGRCCRRLSRREAVDVLIVPVERLAGRLVGSGGRDGGDVGRLPDAAELDGVHEWGRRRSLCDARRR